ncbi:iron chelate uptake ABC transporter family permease subunit [Ornithinimicrobium avium]|uniref:Enterobactin ABC transporter permease n=1 Tax=Ornithinimicrobium avium TaxID=2283195 RepID=A0A345NK13_9MICO|nr:iron chelate uptake ABC transporter family permease subunit [Ornithinimicrobium avium]AXH95371.1 enterobactin ABC transporter permease [Ornithinimicrobium avium]
MTTIAPAPSRRSSPDTPATEDQRVSRTRTVVVALALLVAAACTAYLLYDVRGSWSYAMDLRTRQLAALLITGAAVGASSLVFQTVAGSRILTPSVMGFDALYMLIQTVIVYALGSAAFLALTPGQHFLLDAVLLTVFGWLLFTWLFRRSSRNLLMLVLVGVVLGSFFASLTSLSSRLLSPDDFLTLQDVMFASFSTADPGLLWTAGVVTVLGIAALVPLGRRLDVVALGHDPAVTLGVPFHRTVRITLAVTTMLVAAATALVGPMLFLGLVVANLARQLVPTHRHAVLVPVAILVGVLTCVAGQLVVVHVFDLTTTLSVVVNLVGGLYFLRLLMRTVLL